MPATEVFTEKFRDNVSPTTAADRAVGRRPAVLSACVMTPLAEYVTMSALLGPADKRHRVAIESIPTARRLVMRVIPRVMIACERFSQMGLSTSRQSKHNGRE